MRDNLYRPLGSDALALSGAEADRLLALHDGDCALLYLYALRRAGDFSISDAAAALGLTEPELKRAAERLRAAGLFGAGRSQTKPAPTPADELPEYTAEDIARQSGKGSDFPAVVDETQRILGKTMTGADLKVLFGLYDYLKLPAEVIILLVSHCVEASRERGGTSRLPSMKSIEKEGYVWFNREIMTLERAEEYLQERRRLSGKLNEIKRILQINGRNFSSTERIYVEGWLGLGFDAEAIAEAYDRTVIKTGGLQWKYMNSILQNWHNKGLHSAEEIGSGDRRTQTAAKAPPSATRQRDDGELLDRIFSNLSDK
ncbi:MAG: DnaD domain protein [Oscillospiraceae bacterium]|nr:DnaD domain protein [Oscillospiraceae bacterium]